MNSDTGLQRPKSPQSSDTALDNYGADQMGDQSSSSMANTKSGPLPPILALPTELIQLIVARYLGPLDALHFAAANHATRAVVLPAVYARVVITSRCALAALAQTVECSHVEGGAINGHPVVNANVSGNGGNDAEPVEPAGDITDHAPSPPTFHPRTLLKSISVAPRAISADVTADMIRTLARIVSTCPNLDTADCSPGGDEQELSAAWANQMRSVFRDIASALAPRHGRLSAPRHDLLPWVPVVVSDGYSADTVATLAVKSIDFALGHVGGILLKRIYHHGSASPFPDAWRAASARWSVAKACIADDPDWIFTSPPPAANDGAVAADVFFSWRSADVSVTKLGLPSDPAPEWATWTRQLTGRVNAMPETWVAKFLPTVGSWRNLHSLSLGACQGISDTTVAPLMEALGMHLPHLRMLTLTQVEASYAALLPALSKLVDRGTLRDVNVLGFSARAATAADAAPHPDASEATNAVFAPGITRIKLDQRYRSMQSSLLRPVFSIDSAAAARLTVLSLTGITLAAPAAPNSTNDPRTSFHVVPFFLPRPTDPAGPAQLSTPILPSLLALRTDEPLRLPACPRLQCLVIENAAHYHRATVIADLLGTQFPTVRTAVVMNTFLTIAQTDRLAGTLGGMAGGAGVRPGSPRRPPPRVGSRATSGAVRTRPVDVFLARNVARGLDGWLVAGASAPVADGHGEVDLDELGVEGGALRLVANEVGQKLVDRVLRAWQL
ncbi:hypothetical protein AMAG_05212 [Allomyces macrogynus ATCC 38327]|uniref:F-box domain-containing protein n=1 Tax=Allomyces macrogynus (strain ATCC 38327) TaxID=578462 RepID=A0A0L0SB00_ALLM3|nr:hypothetical protein AMAG_05212 [Allomyces macrogynus ATCC 38327]|eukprot:KNE59748.1 hypothetical protein AMAG_05212 [Allomyces macrogynus ATCC 38327]